MRYAINSPNYGEFADARAMAELAHEAEEAGWDAFFTWDDLGHHGLEPMSDPWVVLSAMAMTTQRIKLGTMVTPVPRRRPWKLARETVTLDRLSAGRLILGVGSGSDINAEYSGYGEAADDKTHGAMLDEGLAVLTGLWSGEPVTFTGQHYQVREARYLPTPLQMPRIPIWVGGYWPHKRPFRRAAQWDGVFPLRADEQPLTPDDVRAILAVVREQRTNSTPFEVAVAGYVGDLEPQAAADKLRALAEAGATWWQEGFLPGDALADARTRIRQGPPRL